MLKQLFGDPNNRKLKSYQPIVSDINLFEEDISLKVEFPFTVTPSIVDKLIKKEETNDTYKSFYM